LIAARPAGNTVSTLCIPENILENTLDTNRDDGLVVHMADTLLLLTRDQDHNAMTIGPAGMTDITTDLTMEVSTQGIMTAILTAGTTRETHGERILDMMTITVMMM
jgi:hypothetical protein